MLKTLVGDDAYAKALDLYFERHDGDAATIEDWLKTFEDATGRDLQQFKLWYSQAGTPRVDVTEDWADGTYTLTFEQHTPPTPGQQDKAAQVIPIAMGLLGPDGNEVQPTQVLEITQPLQSFSFEGLANRPVPSLLRGFSAPIVLSQTYSPSERAFLLAHDTDPFTRWEANRDLARDCLVAMILDGAGPDMGWLSGLEQVLRDRSLDPAYRALMLGLPGQSEMAQVLAEQGPTPDPDAIHNAFETLSQARAEAWVDLLPLLAEQSRVTEAFQPNADQSGKRALGGAVLSLTTRLDGGKAAQAQFGSADNMTLQLSALGGLIRAGKDEGALKAFYDQWRHDRLVIDKWFGMQIAAITPDRAAERAAALIEHPDFDIKNPNRFRAALGALAMHHAGFHRADGAGYRLLADQLIALDDLNPQTTARMCSAFQTWKRYDSNRQALIKTQLERIMAKPNLSRDTSEMVGRILS
jgi:aminopeptidase N